MIYLFLAILIVSCLYIGFRAGYHWRGRPSNGTPRERWMYRYENERGFIFARWKRN